tara:strand:- start:617 stop:1348 length:732 start_codon:yes stop_codon:yes gene_type:complete
MNITNKQLEKLDNKMSINNLPDDILNHIIYYTNETINDKIDKEKSIMKLIEVNAYLCSQIDKLRVDLGSHIKENCIYKIKYKKYDTDYEGLFLINYVLLNSKRDTIHMCEVEADNNNERIFGKFKIIKSSTFIRSRNIYNYELVFAPPKVNYNEPTLLLTEPIRVYGTFNPFFNDYHSWRIFSRTKIVYNDEFLAFKNRYCLVQVISVFKDKVAVKIPEHSDVIKIPKKLLYNTINHTNYGIY